MKTVYMICNAHIDPVWQWTCDEGIATTLSTFRSAADLLEEYDFVFAHNEAVLYRWVERYDPPLFARIRGLVAAGRWKIMGGWFLQPDCNLPAAESLIRQILRGRAYFERAFGPQSLRTACNFDSFGHGGGLPQILRKTGYDSYLTCRPMRELADFPDDFVWRGLDGSEVTALRLGSYNSPMGRAAEKIEGELARLPNRDLLVLWGVGNHGGGPSRADLEGVAALSARHAGHRFVYTAPEDYFAATRSMPRVTVAGSLYPCFPGCYSSQRAVKQRHRQLENALYATEKTAAACALRGLCDVAESELREAEECLLLSEFHDILPGTSVKPAMEESVRRLDGGLARVEEVRTRLMLALTAGQPSAGEGEYPLFVWNPHPYPVEEVVFAPVMMAERFERGFVDAELTEAGTAVPCQVVKEDSNIPIEWAKKVAFLARLRPLSLSRFDLRFVWRENRPALRRRSGPFVFENAFRRIEIDGETGLLRSLRVGGRELLAEPTGLCPTLYTGNEDPWAMRGFQQRRLGEPAAAFRTATREEAIRLCRSEAALPVRLVEDGEVLSEVQALFVLEESSLIVTYRIYRKTAAFDVLVESHFGHRDAMLKLVLPLAERADLLTQIAAATEVCPADGAERPAHKWVCMRGAQHALAVLNDGTYSVSARQSTLELTLLRTPAYAAHYIAGSRPSVDPDRYTPRQDVGAAECSFRLLAGPTEEVLRKVERAALLFNEKPWELNVFPAGGMLPDRAGEIVLEGEEIVLLAMRKSDRGTVFRLYNSAFGERNFRLRAMGAELAGKMKQFEIKTLLLSGGALTECDTMIL